MTDTKPFVNLSTYDTDVSGITEANAQEMQRIKGEAQASGNFDIQSDNIRFHAAGQQESSQAFTTQNYFRTNPDRLPLTLSVFERPEFKAYRGKEIRQNEITGLLNLTGIKAIEKEFIKGFINERYHGAKTIPYDELEATVRANIIPLERIETNNYANYGIENLSKDRGNDNEYTLILNMPEVEHGKTGHFEGDFTTANVRKVDYELRQLDEKTWAAVEGNPMQNSANERNIMNFIGSVGSKEAVEKWIEKRIEEYNARVEKVEQDVNKGLYGHIRVWDEGDTVYIPELQSDFFQGHAARKALIERQPEFKKVQQEQLERQTALLDDLNGGRINQEEYDKEVKRSEKEIEIKKEHVYNILSFAEKQFIASQKVFERRLLHEAVAEARSKGASTVRFPKPHTIAVIEGYIEGAGLPYEIVRQANPADNYLSVGDIIQMGNTEYIVIAADSLESEIEVTGLNSATNIDIKEFVREEADRALEDIFHGFGAATTLTTREEVENNNFNGYDSVKQFLLEKFDALEEQRNSDTEMDDIEIDLEDYRYELKEAIEREFYDNIEDAPVDYFKDRLEYEYGEAIEHDGVVTIWEFPPDMTERLPQPNGRNNISKEDFDVSDLSETQQRVIEKYETIGQQLITDFGSENVSIVEDSDGYDWVELDLSSRKVQNRPIVAFHLIGEQASESPHISAKPFTPISRAEAEALVGLLKKSGLAKEVVFGQEALQQIIKQWGNFQGLNLLKTSAGEIYGAVRDGVVYLDPTKLNANTPIHEFGHLWCDFVEKNNPELWTKIVALTKETPYYKDLLSNPAYAHLKTDDTRVNEAFSQAIGDNGERVFHDECLSATFKERFKCLIKDVWSWVGKKMGIRGLPAEQIGKLTFEQAVKGAVTDMTSGVPIILPVKIGGVPLTNKQHKDLANGKIIYLTNLTNKSGQKYTLNVKWNGQENKLEFSNVKTMKKRLKKEKQHLFKI
jgi:hypothetical protein